jgi:hypothetical protein
MMAAALQWCLLLLAPNTFSLFVFDLLRRLIDTFIYIYLGTIDAVVLSRIYLDTSSTVLPRGTKLPRRRRVLVLKLQSKRCRTSRRVRSCIGLTRVEVSARSGVVARTSTLLRVTKRRHVYHVILCPTSSAVPVLLPP